MTHILIITAAFAGAIAAAVAPARSASDPGAPTAISAEVRAATSGGNDEVRRYKSAAVALEEKADSHAFTARRDALSGKAVTAVLARHETELADGYREAARRNRELAARARASQPETDERR